MRRIAICLALLLPPTAVAEYPAFRLRDQAGKVVSNDDVKDAKAVVFVFLGTQCPINNAVLPRLNELSESFQKDGVRLIGVNANEHDTAAAIREHAKEYKIVFPVLRDEGQRFADALGATRTPEAIVVEPSGKVRYQGRIDDRFGLGFTRPKANTNELADAVAAVVAGKDVAEPKVAAAGCLITRTPRAKGNGTITYTKNIARILQNRCQECHRPGQIGPMPLMNYDEIAPWSAMIKEVVAERRMPPWHADPKIGKFHNARNLTDAERDAVLAWVDQGCPKGDDKDAPAAKAFPDSWSIGTPDAVFEMPRAFNVPATAPARGIAYQYFVVPTNFEEDRWVQAVEAQPGNRAVVHHIIVYVVEGKKRGPVGEDGIGKGMLTAYAPGDFGAAYPAGSAKRIPKGATLVFQMHYTPNGTAQSDRSKVGMIFAKSAPEHQVLSRAVTQQLFFLMPGRDNQTVKSTTAFQDDVVVWSLFPHMHLRGKSFQYEAIYPDGKREVLLSVPRYDFAWQETYRLVRPLELPAGTRIQCTAQFDNSTGNPNNPDPTKMVRWGDQTWEEMMIGFVDYSVRKK